MRTTRFWRHVAVSVLAAGPVGGFLFGVFNAGDPDPNPIGRFFYACIMAGLTPLHGGFPPSDGVGVGQPFNVWPHMAISGVLILSGLLYRDWKRGRKRDEA